MIFFFLLPLTKKIKLAIVYNLKTEIKNDKLTDNQIAATVLNRTRYIISSSSQERVQGPGRG